MRINFEDYEENYHDQKTAFLGIDLQNDFGNPKGSLYVKGGEELIDVFYLNIVDILNSNLVFWTRDYHPIKHCSFKDNGGTWPTHCVQGSWGSKIMDSLGLVNDDEFIHKGTRIDIDSYSAFFDNERKNETELNQILKMYEVDKVLIMGLATDYCVKFTALDAASLGYKTFVYLPGCRGVNINPNDADDAVKAMENAGVIIIDKGEYDEQKIIPSKNKNL